MQYGICNLNTVAVRAEAADASEMVTQLLYGDHFKILEKRKSWSRIRIAFDGYEGWVDDKQYQEISEEVYGEYEQKEDVWVADLIEYAVDQNNQLTTVSLGGNRKAGPLLKHQFDGLSITGKKAKDKFLEIAFLYLNAPYLWGGKTPFGIDCSGLTQMVYRLNGYQLYRDASQQAKQGEALSFIEESEPGDLAFFDNQEGDIIHVGIIMKDNYVIHAHGKVRIDRIDHSGIFNVDTNRYSHNLRVIKKIV